MRQKHELVYGGFRVRPGKDEPAHAENGVAGSLPLLWQDDVAVLKLLVRVLLLKAATLARVNIRPFICSCLSL